MQKNSQLNSPHIKTGNITTQQGHANIGNVAEDNANFGYSVTTITPQPENISQQPNEPVNQDQQINLEEQGLASVEEVKKNKPTWKERKDYQIAAATLVVTLLTGTIVPIVLKVTGKV
ncbi:MAG: hypothetical protein MRERV_1c047 [Mycoplasmataceae bacterium RV_VA103A]|nr:MAG: hypothetical protein MRERV_10c066 [Mycoplasmataceae bacterium RV_VA103A]KLL05375.1 MAG: hypothetical protein MRERV_1c047 [Mycoplasmataceae bacterium RV_VA103A]